MIVKVGTGRGMGGLMQYLFGAGRANEHTDQHVVAGSGSLAAEYNGAIMDRATVAQLGRQLNFAHAERSAELRVPLGVAATRVAQGLPAATETDKPRPHVFHVSLSLPAEDGRLDDETWARIAQEYVDEMGLSSLSGKADCAWVAVRHGLSKSGNDHIHLAVSLVREDGTWASDFQSYKRSARIARSLERKYGLRQLHDTEAQRGRSGYSQGEARRAGGVEHDTERVKLGRLVRAAALGADTESDFLRRLNSHGIQYRPRWDRAENGEKVVGYSVKLRSGELWFGGGRLARDLSLSQLRQRWEAGDQQRAEALPLWKGKAGAEERSRLSAAETERAWEAVDAQLRELNEWLSAADPADQGAWSRAADAAAAIAAEAALTAPDAKASASLARLSDRLSRSANDQLDKARPAVQTFSALRSLDLLRRAGSPSGVHGWYAVLVQLERTARAIQQAHHARQELIRATELRESLARELTAARDAMRPATMGRVPTAGRTATSDRPRTPAAPQRTAGPRIPRTTTDRNTPHGKDGRG